jgi:hypothetical protein
MASGDGRSWRSAKASVAIFAMTMACGALIAGDESPIVPMTAFSVAVEPSALDRHGRTLTVWVVGTGYCVGHGEPDPRSRFDHFDVDVEDRAVLLTAWIREQPGLDDDGFCAGIGSLPFAKTVDLPEPIGDRALISRTYPGVSMSVLALPRGENAAAERFAGGAYIYEGEDCAAARTYFRGPPEDWCAKLF